MSCNMLIVEGVTGQNIDQIINDDIRQILLKLCEEKSNNEFNDLFTNDFVHETQKWDSTISNYAKIIERHSNKEILYIGRNNNIFKNKDNINVRCQNIIEKNITVNDHPVPGWILDTVVFLYHIIKKTSNKCKVIFNLAKEETEMCQRIVSKIHATLDSEASPIKIAA
jgi:hypothetical protein